MAISNHDGIVDIALSTSNSVEVLRGNGDGTFQTPVNTQVPKPVGAFAAADLNHDGDLDLAGVLKNAQLQTVVDVLSGNGDGTFQPPTANIVGREASSSVAADFNGDGTLDLATAMSAKPVGQRFQELFRFSSATGMEPSKKRSPTSLETIPIPSAPRT